MIYAVILDRSEMGHVMPVVAELRARKRTVQVLGPDFEGELGRDDVVLCVGDRLDLLRWLVAHAPRSIICQLHAGETTTEATDDSRFRWVISSMAYRMLCATHEAVHNALSMRIGGSIAKGVGSPCLQRAAKRKAEAAENPPLDARDYVLFAMNGWVGSSRHHIEDALRHTARAARDRGWWVYAMLPNVDSDPRPALVGDHNVIVHSEYSMGHGDFQRLIAGAHLMVGNSSAGIIEAPSLGTQTIDIRPRQDGREMASSILRVPLVDIESMPDSFARALRLGFDVRPYDSTDDPAGMAADAILEVVP